jgi:hypothetical protein
MSQKSLSSEESESESEYSIFMGGGAALDDPAPPVFHFFHAVLEASWVCTSSGYSRASCAIHISLRVANYY